MALRDLTSRDAVLAAIREFDALKRDRFLRQYGFGHAREYELIHEGRRYDSKAIVGAAHGHQHPSLGPLKSTDFSGGEPTISKLRELGFEVVSAEQHQPTDRTAGHLARFLELYSEAKRERFTGNHEACDALKSAALSLGERLKPLLPEARVVASVGRGNWASVPWIAVLDPRETDTTQHGTYPVVLIPEDLSGVYLTLAQGVTDLKNDMGRRAAYDEMNRRAQVLRGHLDGLEDHGFLFDIDVDLGGSPLGRDYAASIVAARHIAASDLLQTAVEGAVIALSTAYAELLADGGLEFTEPDTTSPSVLCVYVGQGAYTNFETGGRQRWWGWREAPTGLEALRPGDLVVFGRGYTEGSPRVDAATWQAGGLARLTVGRVRELPTRTDESIMPDELAGEASYPWKFRFDLLGDHDSVPLSPPQALSAPVVDALRRSAINRGHGIIASAAGSPLLESYLRSHRVTEPPSGQTTRALADAFWEQVQASGMQLDRPRTLAFLAAALAKPFVILTGQSGSGKTQLAQRLGEWCGADYEGRPRHLIVPVRPDWTGSEYLFGYPDALRPPSNGRPVWAVPQTLEFLLRAHDEPSAPYVLVLDEMNLAHVERYFADFLSGVESGHPVLPELEQSQGQWVGSDDSRLPIPTNLIVVGTVNVDETTYLFSPKVLDRAFTFEFRVGADDLDGTLRRPGTTAAATESELLQLMEIARDREWHFAEPHPSQEQLVDELRTLHRTLAPAGLDFGHRVMFEALRFASLLHGMTGANHDEALDFVVLTKLLPKIHGSRQRLEPVLRALLDFAGGGDNEEPSGAGARLPRSAEKLGRMLTTLLDVQFVSFTE